MTAARDLQRKLPEGAMQLLLSCETLPPPAVTRSFGVKENHSWHLSPYQVFQPLGLLFWGATEDTFITRMQIGNQEGASISGARLPAKYFSTGRSFDELKKLAAQGELQLSIPERQILDCPLLEMNCHLRVETVGPFESFCAWGIIHPDYANFRTVKVVCNDVAVGGYRGTIIDETMTGHRQRFAAEATTEAGCIQLLETFLGKPRW